jgi:hypothetical protein
LSDSPLCSGAVDFQMRTRRGVLILSRRDTRRSWPDIFITGSTHQWEEWRRFGNNKGNLSISNDFGTNRFSYAFVTHLLTPSGSPAACSCLDDSDASNPLEQRHFLRAFQHVQELRHTRNLTLICKNDWPCGCFGQFFLNVSFRTPSIAVQWAHWRRVAATEEPT